VKSGTLLAFIATISLVISSAQARKLPDYDAVANATPMSASNATSLRTGMQPLLRPGSELHTAERFGVPNFLWASPEASQAGLAALAARSGKTSALASGNFASAGFAAADAARAHLETYSAFYGLDSFDIANATVSHVHDIGRGPIIVQFRQTIGGIEVFREQARVVMSRDLKLVAISGFISSSGGDASLSARGFGLGSAQAVANAFSDLSGLFVNGSEMKSLGALEGGYEALDLSPGLKGSILGATTQPARAKPVYFHLGESMIPAWYVEVDSAVPGGSDWYSYVVSADDGSILFRHDLTAYDVAPGAVTYRVWAYPADDPNNPAAPWDGPHGNNLDPHPTGTLDGSQPVFMPQNDVTLVSSPYVTDPWLPLGATESNGNNVDAYVDLITPDGFTAGTDFRADVTSPNAFARTYDPTHPNAINQQKAAIIQMFYNNNFFHDWYYASGFTESAGNAQSNNYGRGGIAGDNIRAEGQDFSGRNNANMSTPADGGRPRMQMYLFDGIAERHLFLSGPINQDFATGVPSGFGISSHDVTGEVVWLNDGIGSTTYPPATTTTTTIHDGCDYTPGPNGAVDPNWTGVTGKIAFIDRGGTSANPAIACGFQVKAFNATQAGALGVLIASTTPHGAPSPINMGAGTGAGNGPVTIPVYQLSTPDGDLIRSKFGPDGHGATGPITARLLRATAVDRDGTIDNQVMAHEWGHYISNRLVANSSGLTTNMSRGMGEGWADTHAMLLTVKEEDAQVPANANYSGVYGLAIWVTTGGPNGPSPNQGAYFGIRRMPYSTDFTKNNMTFKNIQDNSAIPFGVPFSFWPAPGTTAVNGGNSEVHNTGEVWATMLWECYASLLRDTVGPSPRLSFATARNRWKDYLVAAYKLTPPQPTFLEARDAVLAAAYAGGDLTDYNRFLAAFARRGAGFGAVSPDRYSGTNNGVVESFTIAPNLVFVSATFNDDVSNCDADGNLDSGETGHLLVTLRNDSNTTLSALTASVTPSGANGGNLFFPNGNIMSFGAIRPLETVTGSLPMGLLPGLSGVQQIDLRIDYSDAVRGSQTVTVSRRANFDDVAGQSFTDDVESATPAFTQILLGNPVGQPLAPGWFRNEITPLDHNYKCGDLNGITDIALVSPAMSIGTSPLIIGFQHRYNFEFSGATLFDGGVVEISSDGGNTWTDVTLLPTPAVVTGQGYTGSLAAGGGNPLGTRRAFGGISPGYPAYVSTSFNLGTQFAGRAVSFRFRIGSDSNGRADGWEIDNINAAGAAARPFRALLPNKCNFTTSQTNRRPVASISAQGAVPERTLVTLSGAASTDADGDALQYFWGQLSGTPVTITQSPASPTMTFTAPEVPAAGGSVVMTLTVSDGTAFSTTVTRTVAITNVDQPPTASAGAPQTVDEGSLVLLSGSGADPDGDALSFSWTQTSGPTVTLVNANTATAVFVAPQVDAAGATLGFQLAVTANGQTATATTTVTVNNVNHAPTASAGSPQTVDAGAVVQLQGSANDIDGDPLTFAWKVSPETPSIALGNPNALSTGFTAPSVSADTEFTFQLAVSDGIVASPTISTVKITIRRPNLKPVAVAEAPSLVDPNTPVNLDGSASHDPNGDPLTYEWSVAPGSSLPLGSSLTNADRAIATFDPGEVAADTTVTFSLRVSDGLETSSATVSVLVVHRSSMPVVTTTPLAAASSGGCASGGSGSLAALGLLFCGLLFRRRRPGKA
jgi:hypothetical protein